MADAAWGFKNRDRGAAPLWQAVYANHALSTVAEFETQSIAAETAVVDLREQSAATRKALDGRLDDIDAHLAALEVAGLQALRGDLNGTLVEQQSEAGRRDTEFEDAKRELTELILRKTVAKHAGTVEKQADHNGWIAIGAGVVALLIVGGAGWWGTTS